ncbi:MAG: potassium-transporting ATPase subunit KdpA, partial [Methanoregula sp.]|uniref:potassium-transporting ATPase subunit KdpA n=1 Tax=Methanoregula sp. TaxID=2052170 RepID=UPI003BB21A21
QLMMKVDSIGASSALWSMIKKQIKPAVVMFLLLTILVGIVYPLVVTGIAQVIFPVQANGDLIVHDGNVAGSSLIGQPFSSPDYFWGRLSATSPVPYDAEASGGSNYGPQNPALITEVQTRTDALHAVDPDNTQPIPVDLVTSSGSGLDPDISPAAAYYQVPRIARVRNLSENDVSALVAANTANPVLGIFGEPAVNVLSLNLALDDLSAHKIPVNPAAMPRSQPANTLFGITVNDWVFLILLGVILALLLVPMGEFMFRVYTGKQTFLSPVIMPVEGWILRTCGAGSEEEMDWKQFAAAMMIFSVIGIAFVFFIQEIQQFLPLNPVGAGPVPWDLSLNTAVSFATNTNWQFYVPETTVSYLTQMVGLAVQNFMSAAVGMAVLVAFIYGFSRRSTLTIGNFWVLLVRGIWILLPISFVIALVLVSQGTPQTFGGPVTVPLLNPVNDSNGNLVTTQSISLGPAASQIAIKMLGTNGGGFFNANSAHPYENPTWLSNLIEIIAILLIPVSLCFMFGKMIGSVKKGLAILVAMTLLFVPLLGLGIWSEMGGNPAFTPLGIDQAPSHLQAGGNMEGKEVRFGIVPSAAFSVITTVTSCGAVNSMHDSFMPLGGLVQIFDIQLGEIVYGGVGSGLYCMLVFIIIAMFIAGLMVGRTPELYGKKIEPYEMKLSTIHILIPIFLILIGTAIAVSIAPGTAAVFNPGPHGFSEILYAFSSVSQNNGSAFAGLSSNLFYNLATTVCMFVGRYAIAIITLALAGAFVTKKIVPASEGTLQDHRPLFIIWVVFTILIIGALSFLPALSLGPVVEFLIQVGRGVIHV